MDGQLGDGTAISQRTSAAAVVKPAAWNGTTVLGIAAGSYHTLAVLSNGELYAWGVNSYSQLGDGSTTKRTTPIRVTGLRGLAPVAAIAAGVVHSLAALSNGTVYAWGSNHYGQVGDGTTSQRATATAVVKPAAWNGLTVTSVGAGYFHSVALMSDGAVYTWGDNQFGALGDGTQNQRTTPGPVLKPAAWSGSTVVAIAVGNFHCLALLSNGALYAWGRNNYGQIGDGTTVLQRINATAVVRPAAWTGLNITAIAAGAYHSMALMSDGALYAWGYNDGGTLGDGTTTGRKTATAVVRPPAWNDLTISAIAAGYFHSMALLSNGALFAWGQNTDGQLGDGTTVQRNNATAVVQPALDGLTMAAFAGGGFHSVVLVQ